MMNSLFKLLQNKFARTVVALTLIIFVMILIFSPNARRSELNEDSTSNPEPRGELINLADEKRRESMIYVAEIESKLPIYLENFRTSVGITTAINLYRFDSDEAEVVRLEIYGLSYMNSETDELKNPNVTAFKESYVKALEMLEGKNIDPKKLIFIYGDKDYVRKTAATWVSALNLAP